MRYLYAVDDDSAPFAYAPGRRDFFRTGDDLVWAHESHGWLIAARSGETLAHRTGDVYYSATDGKGLYRLSAERVGASPPSSDADVAPKSGPRRASRARP